MARAPRLTEDQQDAWDALKEDVLDYAREHGWRVVDPQGVTKTHAYASLDHPALKDRFKAMIPVDPDGKPRFIQGSTVLTGRQAMTFLKTLTLESAPAPKAKKKAATPAASAAHSAAHQQGVPPTSAAHPAGDAPVPPTVPPTTSSAAHPWDDAAHDVMADLADAAHPKLASNAELRAHHSKMRETTTDGDVVTEEDFDDVEIDEAAEFKGHVDQARPVSNPGWPTVMHEDLKSAIQAYSLDGLWSEFASTLSDEEILSSASNAEIVWRNRLSGRMDDAVVVPGDPAKSKYRPHITGSVVEEHDDRRVIHFLEAGGGFRSVAVGLIKSIG